MAENDLLFALGVLFQPREHVLMAILHKHSQMGDSNEIDIVGRVSGRKNGVLVVRNVLEEKLETLAFVLILRKNIHTRVLSVSENEQIGLHSLALERFQSQLKFWSLFSHQFFGNKEVESEAGQLLPARVQPLQLPQTLLYDRVVPVLGECFMVLFH